MISAKTFLHLMGTIFTVIGFLHLLRLMTGWQIIIGRFGIPVWISFFGMLIAWVLAYNAFVLAGKIKNKK